MKNDVLVIGGGIAGLSAARRLTEAGLSVVLLEARERLGGRICTHHTADYPVELGAEFVHGRPEEILSLAAEAALPVIPVRGNFRRKINGSWVDAGHLMEKVDELFGHMPADGPDQSFRHYLDHTGASAEVRRQALRYVEGFHAADPSLLSVHWLLRDFHAEEAIQGDRQFRIATGYDQLVRAVADRIDKQRCEIVTNTVVKEIHWQAGQVIARTAASEFLAARAVVTLPLGVLKARSVAFAPALPQKEAAIEFLEMGAVIRASLCFATKFWEQDSEMAGLGFLFSDDNSFPTWWASNPLPYPILTGWAAGGRAVAMKGRNQGEIVDMAVQSLARIIGNSPDALRRQVAGAFVHDWQADPFSRGGYSYAAVGGIDAARSLAAPVAETLYFAGEATDSDGHNGTVHGAIATGLRAAQEVLESSGIASRSA
ncbi:MAG TPA: NAD(P)/FAD-dependent oxidoreductase [Candidatus Angelobacter sp.]|nr:NAD(P)/FAD-dependent oxidoreductase [Candidatus Angelobacter sp.]